MHFLNFVLCCVFNTHCVMLFTKTGNKYTIATATDIYACVSLSFYLVLLLFRCSFVCLLVCVCMVTASKVQHQRHTHTYKNNQPNLYVCICVFYLFFFVSIRSACFLQFRFYFFLGTTAKRMNSSARV